MPWSGHAILRASRRGPPNRAAVPAPLSTLVMKLLAKKAEERY